MLQWSSAGSDALDRPSTKAHIQTQNKIVECVYDIFINNSFVCCYGVFGVFGAAKHT